MGGSALSSYLLALFSNSHTGWSALGERFNVMSPSKESPLPLHFWWQSERFPQTGGNNLQTPGSYPAHALQSKKCEGVLQVCFDGEGDRSMLPMLWFFPSRCSEPESSPRPTRREV